MPSRLILFKSPIAMSLLLLAFATSAYSEDKVQTEILQRIEQSKKSLSRLEEKIGAENRALSKKLSTQQNEIISLRTRAAEAQRIKDEQLLSLETIKNRVEKWETQSLYQKHLLRAFTETTSFSRPSQDASNSGLLENALTELQNKLQPDWKDAEIIAESGEVYTTPVLKVGPAEVAFNPQEGSSTLVSRSFQGQANAIDVFSQPQHTHIKNLYESGKGYFIFDPSLGSALKMRNQGDTLVSHVSKGGVWALPILFFGLLSLVIAVFKGFHLWMLPRLDLRLFEKLRKLVNKTPANDAQSLPAHLNKILSTQKSAQKDLIKIALETPPSPYRDELMFAFLLEYRHKLDRFLGVVATSAAIAPLLGLLGTVSGMISTFKLMTIFGSGDASTVSGGISEALVTTELGLIVAIPSLVISALLARKSKSYNHKLESFAIKLSQLEFNLQTGKHDKP